MLCYREQEPSQISVCNKLQEFSFQRFKDKKRLEVAFASSDHYTNCFETKRLAQFSKT